LSKGALLAGVAALAALLWMARQPASGPVEPAWDHTTCARCGMLVSEPAFAGQLHLASGEVLHFDDPGCLLLERAERGADVRAAYLHHYVDERWLPLEEVAFVRESGTPMGHGFAALGAGAAPEALTLDEVTRELERAEQARRRR
jgi:hypothetical protein